MSGLSKLTKGKGISENPLALSDILEVERLIMLNRVESVEMLDKREGRKTRLDVEQKGQFD